MLVFATIFVCGGGYTAADVDNWLAMMTGEKTAVITIDNCDHLGYNNYYYYYWFKGYSDYVEHRKPQ